MFFGKISLPENLNLYHSFIRLLRKDLDDLLLKPKSIIESCIFFLLALDESTDISDTSWFPIFRHIVHNNFTVEEKLVKMCLLNGGTKNAISKLLLSQLFIIMEDLKNVCES